MEVTKWLKPSISVSRIGDSASVQAVTRVNAEQALYEAFEVKHYLTAFSTSFRASATIVVLRRRPPLRSIRSLNHRVSAEPG